MMKFSKSQQTSSKLKSKKTVSFAKTDDVYIMEKAHIIKVRLRTMAMADKIKET